MAKSSDLHLRSRPLSRDARSALRTPEPGEGEPHVPVHKTASPSGEAANHAWHRIARFMVYGADASPGATARLGEIRAALIATHKPFVRAAYNQPVDYEHNLGAYYFSEEGSPAVIAFHRSLERLVEELEALGAESTEPDRELLEAARAFAGPLNEAVMDMQGFLMRRDLLPLLEKLSSPVLTHQAADPLVVCGGTVNPVASRRDRYRLRDRVAVRLDDGTVTEGLVVRARNELDHSDRSVAVEFLDERGRIARRTLSLAEQLAENPIRIGHFLADVPGMGAVWCDGVGSDELFGLLRRPDGQLERLDAVGLHAAARAYAARIAAQIDPSIGFPSDLLALIRSEAADPRQPLPMPDEPVRYLGGAETPLDAVYFECETAELAGLTSHGRHERYKRFNEDGFVFLRGIGEKNARRVEYVGNFVFDTLGGMARIEAQVGLPAVLTARRLEKAFGSIVAGRIDPERAFRSAFIHADRDVRRASADALRTGTLQVGSRARADMSTTVVAMVLVDGQDLYFGVVGDSQVIVVANEDGEGRIDGLTQRHNAGDEAVARSRDRARQDPMSTIDVHAGVHSAHAVTNAIGVLEKGRIQTGMFKVYPGDQVVAITDGVGDANEHAELAAHHRSLASGESTTWTFSGPELTREQLEEAFRLLPNAAALVRVVEAYVLRFVEMGRAKPDNITITVMTVKGATPPGEA